MRRKRIVSFVLTAMLATNLVSAEMLDMSSDGLDVKKDEATQQDKENIIETLKDKLGAEKTPEEHKQPEGAGGISQAFAYITPMKQFGYMYSTMKMYGDYSGNKIRYSDDLATSKKDWWGTSDEYGRSYAFSPLYTDANKYFTNKIKNTINIPDSQIDKAFKQKTKDGKGEFIAATLYIRWSYDIRWYNVDEDKISPEQEELKRKGSDKAYVPIKTPNANGGGPYFSVGEWMEYDPGIMDDLVADKFNPSGNSARETLRRETATRHMSYKQLFGENPPIDVPYIDCDMGMTGDDWAARNKNGVFEKHAEVRRYINSGEGTPEYEAVIPVKTTVVKEQFVTPNVAPKVSIDGDVKYENGNPIEYIFDVEMGVKTPTYNYSKDEEKYVFKRNGSGVLETYSIKEPRDNQLDVWHDNLKPVLEIRDASGILACTPIPLQNIKKQRVIVKASDVNYADISGGEATVNVGFDSNARYLSKTIDYDKKYKHSSNGQLNSISDIGKYIEIKLNSGDGVKNSLYASLQKAYVESNPRLEKIFTTNRHKDKNISASTSIWVIPPDGDSDAPDVIVDVDPPNALTKVEGGNFDVNVDVDYDAKDPNLTILDDKEYEVKNENELPPGEVGEHLWVDDFKIDSISVKAEDGSIIFEEEYGKSFEITEETPGKISAVIRDLEANPSQIGEATVEVKYSYNRYHRKWKKSPSAEYELVDGVVVPSYWIINASTSKTPQTGVATGSFNIYSLTGITN